MRQLMQERRGLGDNNQVHGIMGNHATPSLINLMDDDIPSSPLPNLKPTISLPLAFRQIVLPTARPTSLPNPLKPTITSRRSFSKSSSSKDRGFRAENMPQHPSSGPDSYRGSAVDLLEGGSGPVYDDVERDRLRGFEEYNAIQSQSQRNQ